MKPSEETFRNLFLALALAFLSLSYICAQALGSAGEYLFYWYTWFSILFGIGAVVLTVLSILFSCSVISSREEAAKEKANREAFKARSAA